MENINPIELNEALEKTMIHSSYYAKRLRNYEITTLHVTYYLLINPDVELILNKLGIKDKERREIQEKLVNSIANLSVDPSADLDKSSELGFSRDVSDLFQKMYVNGNKYGLKVLTGADLLAVVCDSAYASGNILKSSGITTTLITELLKSHLWKKRKDKEKEDGYQGASYDEAIKKMNFSDPLKLTLVSEDDTEMSAIKAQQNLEKYATNLNYKAKLGLLDNVIGRNKEIDRCIRTLSRRKKSNLVFVGDAGVGKTAIVHGLANRIVNKEVHTCLKDATIFEFDLPSLVAGTTYRGDLEKRVKLVLECLDKLPDAILFIDEIHTIVGAGAASGGLDISNMLKPALADGRIRCIGATTEEEYRKLFESSKAMSRRFLKLEVLEPSIEDSIEIARGIQKSYEAYHNVAYSDDAIVAACELSAHYLPNKSLPDKAIDLLDEVGATIKLNANRLDKIVTKKDIETAISEVAKIPSIAVSDNGKFVLHSLKERLQDNIIGQDKAVETVANAMILARSGLRDESRPIANLLLAGPTGVGKTELCKQLALELGVKFLRFDMSEYQEPHTVARLLGSPAGYVGYEEGGLLTEAINKTPNCILLLDEIEKANPTIYNVLLGLMDYGKLTDGQGREIDCRHVTLVMTTNQGARALDKASVGFMESNVPEDITADLKEKFSPEFRNRLDAIIQFNKLTPSVMEGIVKKFLYQLNEKFMKQHITLHVTDGAVKWLCDNGYDSALGARPLKRVITENIAQPASYLILFEEIEGEPILNVVEDNGKLKVELISKLEEVKCLK